jgi:hypothetical protein
MHVETVADIMVLAGATCLVTSESGFSNAVRPSYLTDPHQPCQHLGAVLAGY